MPWQADDGIGAWPNRADTDGTRLGSEVMMRLAKMPSPEEERRNWPVVPSFVKYGPGEVVQVLALSPRALMGGDRVKWPCPYPWGQCDGCDWYLSPAALGACPNCGRLNAETPRQTGVIEAEVIDNERRS